jgi:drug/metabolite transporter (DMT)-like permease
MAANRERVALASFITGSVLAGGNAVGVRFSNRELAPLWGAGLRFLVAAALLVAVMAALRQPPPRGRALTGALLYGLFNFGGAFALAYYGFVRVHAGLGQTLLALVPLATLLLAVVQGQERLRAAAVVGTLLAVAGIAVMSRAPLQGSVPLLSLLALVGSALCFAEAAVLVRRFPRVHPVAMNAVGMGAGGALLVAGSLLAGERLALPQRAATWLAVGYLVVVGSVVVFVLYIVVLRYWSASRAAYTFVLVPVVTVVLSWWLDDEPVGAGLVLGGLLVLAGVYVGALRPAQVAPARPAIPAPAEDGQPLQGAVLVGACPPVEAACRGIQLPHRSASP